MKPNVVQVVSGVQGDNMAIKAIVFDCFGVLVKSGHNVLRQDFPELKDLVDDMQAKSDFGILSRLEFNHTIARKTGLAPKEIDERYWGTNKYNYEVIDFAYDLKTSGKFKVGLLSNISRDWMDESFAIFNEKNLFDEVILSGDINVVKPNPLIFKMMAEKLGVKPYECIMIDDVADNINGARIAGMHGIVFFSAQQIKEDLSNILDNNNA
jgi:HAD superfamily hydrolase (TIGR01509 family)